MKRNSFISLIAVFFAFFIGAVVSSCDDSKDDALSEGLSIKVFSPTKVIEGQEVMISGTGLDGVTSVVFPGGVSVTTIKVVTSNDIRVITPAGISPEGGELTIQAGNQSVTARIPVTIGSPSVATLAPGDQAGIGTELTVTGADMEFFEKAIFPGKEGDVTVAAVDFVRKSTSLLKLKVPAGIASGSAQIRLVTCANKEVLLPKLDLIAMVLGEKGPLEGEWVWGPSPAWGSAGYLASRGPEWWGVSVGPELDEYGQEPGEGVAEASMVFTGPFMTKNRADGTAVTGQYSVDMTKTKVDGNGNIWAIGQLTTEDATLLCGRWPWAGEEHDIYTYDILELSADYMVLSYALDGTGAWGNALFWIFQRKGASLSTYPVDLTLSKGQTVTLDGIDDIADWWIDPDFLSRVEGSDNKFTFQAMDGDYRINANKGNKYFTIEVLSNGNPATTQTDGTGAVWVIGDGIGKPTNANNIGWTDSKAICMAPIGNKKYRITLVAGSQIGTDAINFKFFHQKGWGGEFKDDTISITSDLILLGNGSNGADPGNLMLQPGVTLEDGVAYEFIVDLSGGINSAVLTVTQK